MKIRWTFCGRCGADRREGRYWPCSVSHHVWTWDDDLTDAELAAYVKSVIPLALEAE